MKENLRNGFCFCEEANGQSDASDACGSAANAGNVKCKYFQGFLGFPAEVKWRKLGGGARGFL